MCECNCGELNLVAAHPIEGTDAVLGLHLYPGCSGCGTPIGVTAHLFDPEGWRDWGTEGFSGIKLGEPIKPDAYGGCDGYGLRLPLIGKAELVKAARTDEELKEIDLSDYDSLGDLLEQWGLVLLQEALRHREKGR